MVQKMSVVHGLSVLAVIRSVREMSKEKQQLLFDYKLQPADLLKILHDMVYSSVSEGAFPPPLPFLLS